MNVRKIVSAIIAAVMVPVLNGGGKLLNERAYITDTAYAAVDMGIENFDLDDFTMTDSYCTNAFSKELSYLLSLDTERLLAGFRDNAGLSTNGAKRYDGWENSLIGGHCVGHYLSALAQAYNNQSLTAEQKQQVYSRITTMIDGLKICQDNSKGRAGFLWGATKADANNVEAQFDNVENGKTNIITEAWVPWYTMHKLISGLNDIYRLTGYAPAKTVSCGLGDWVYNRVNGWSSSTQARVLGIEYGGMNDCLYDLYDITGTDKYAVAAHKFDETALFEKVYAGGTNVLNNRHANTTIPKFLGALKRYTVIDGKTVNGEKVDADIYLKYAEAFWEMVTTHHTYITGGNSEWEHFGADDVLDAERTNCNCETCNSYNMLKLSRELFKITGDKKYMDYYENTYYNSILSSQNPETGMTTYFQPMATGYFKVYSTATTKFWCCTGSGMESFSKLGDTIYMHKDNILYVNLYQSSVLDWAEQGVKITQVSTIPDGDTASFTISGSSNLDLRFRIPDWISGNLTMTQNGTAVKYTTVDGYAQLSGSFSDGDVISLALPETVTAFSLPDNSASYGFKYGPVVLSAELGTNNMTQGVTGMSVSIPKEKDVSSENIHIDEKNGTVGEFMADISDYLVKDKNSLKFTLTGTDTPLTFTPHYRQYQQRYGIYWYFYASGEAAEREDPRAKVTVIDTVQPGYGQYENDELHDMYEVNTVGITDDSTYRYTTGHGYFTYRMAVDTSAPMTVLQFTLRKADNGKTLKVAVGDTVLYSKALSYDGNSDIYNEKIQIPSDVLADSVYTVAAYGKETAVVDVTFSAADGKGSAKVCDFVYMTAVKPLYDFDRSIAYFVDCGDHNTATLTGTDKLGIYNSATEQLYGADSVTGRHWGIIDDSTDRYNGSSKSKGIYTANTWPNEWGTTDGQDKENTFRYTKNQYENNIDRHLDYGFELPDGTYTVELGFSNPWSCSERPTVYANYGTASQLTLAENISVGKGTSAKADVKVTDGYLSLNIKTDDKCINVTYITISFKNADEYETESHIGDVNNDGSFSVADLVLTDNWLLGTTTVITDSRAADICKDNRLNIFDLCALRKILFS